MTFLIKITTHDEPQEVIREDERNIIYFENYFTAIFKLIISSTEHYSITTSLWLLPFLLRGDGFQKNSQHKL